MSIGALFTADDLVTVDMPVELIPRNALKDELEVIGRVTKVALVNGEMILRHHLADPTNIAGDLAFVIDDDQVLMAFQPGDLMSGLNVLKRGDRVDILVTIEKSAPQVELDTEARGDEILIEERKTDEAATRMFTFDAMQAVEITAMIADIQYAENQEVGPLDMVQGQTTEASEAEPRQPAKVTVRAYLLAISPQDALVLKHLKDVGGSFDLVLRSAAPPIQFDLDPVIDEYIVDKYNLEVIK